MTQTQEQIYQRKYRETHRESLAEYQRVYREKNREKRKADGARRYLENREEIRRTARDRHIADPRARLLSYAGVRARRKGISFDLALDDIIVPTHCPLLGIELVVGPGRSHAASPSLDRIDPGGGYVRGNVQVISHRANTIKSDLTEDQLVNFCKTVLASRT